MYIFMCDINKIKLRVLHSIGSFRKRESVGGKESDLNKEKYVLFIKYLF